MKKCMNVNSDPMYEQYKNLDFKEGKPVCEIPALYQLQAEQAGKACIIMRVESQRQCINSEREKWPT